MWRPIRSPVTVLGNLKKKKKVVNCECEVVGLLFELVFGPFSQNKGLNLMKPFQFFKQPTVGIK